MRAEPRYPFARANQDPNAWEFKCTINGVDVYFGKKDYIQGWACCVCSTLVAYLSINPKPGELGWFRPLETEQGYVFDEDTTLKIEMYAKLMGGDYARP